MILYAGNEDLKPLKSGGDRDKVLGWVDELATNGTLAQHTRYTGPEGSGIQRTLREQGKLRLDLQRVFNTGTVTTTKIVKFFEKGNLIDQSRIDAIQKMPRKQQPKIQMVEQEEKTYEAIWSLFAVQVDDSHNQVFVLNNPSFNLSNADWRDVFRNSLEGPYAAIVTTAKDKLPSGFSQHDCFEL